MSTPSSSREELISRLHEAAEVEHNLMCVYLYAAFSLKDGQADGLSEEHTPIVQGWRNQILTVAREEMLHLVFVSNLLVSLGGAAHFGRMNFPIPRGALPADMQVRLAPFTRDTLQHFIWLERPDGVDEPMGEGFVPTQMYKRALGSTAPHLMPHAIDYPAVGALYHQIETDLVNLVERLGEDQVFIGPRDGQIDEALSGLTGAQPVICLKSARAAIHAIVEQGEGARLGDADSHYGRFKAIAREYDAIIATDAGFKPAFAAAHNPVMRRPPTPEGKVWIEAQSAASIVDLANAIYAHMLRLLIQGFGRSEDDAQRAALIDTSISMMHAMMLVAQAAVHFPASDSDDSCRAGMSFAILRSLAPLPRGPGEWGMLQERMSEISEGASRLSPLHPKLAQASALLGKANGRFSALVQRFVSASVGQVAAVDASVTLLRTVPPSVMTDGVEVVEGEDLTLLFEAKRCIHARFCVTGLPDVFKANVEGAWLDPDAASTEALVGVAHACPSGAIRYQRKNDRPQEPLPAVNILRLRENGPYAVHSDMDLVGQGTMTRATLCRCGASKNKPFCDNSHIALGFAATGEPESRESSPLVSRSGPLEVAPQTNGPLQVRGNLEICCGTGRTVDRVTSVRLCRCGGSKTKPFCDNSHLTNGFQAD